MMLQIVLFISWVCFLMASLYFVYRAGRVQGHLDVMTPALKIRKQISSNYVLNVPVDYHIEFEKLMDIIFKQ